MNETQTADAPKPDDDTRTPGTHEEGGHGSWRIYVAGFVLAALQTALAFAVASTSIMTHDSNIAAIACLAIGQVLVQLIFFIHLSTSPDSSVNIAAVLYVMLVIALLVLGSIWIMGHPNANMMPMDPMMQMQR